MAFLPLTARAFAATGGRNSKEETNAITEFHHHYQQTGHTSKAYERVVETLEAPARAGYRLGLCTNKSMAGTELVLKNSGHSVFLAPSLLGTPYQPVNHTPEPLLEAIRQLGRGAASNLYWRWPSRRRHRKSRLCPHDRCFFTVIPACHPRIWGGLPY